MFEDDTDEIANEVDELTRLMSCVGIENEPDLDELDKQTNLAGLIYRFLKPSINSHIFQLISSSLFAYHHHYIHL